MRTMEDCMEMDTIMTMSEDFDGTKHIFRLNVSGKKIGFRVSNEYPIPEACFPPILKARAFKAIHNYISDFFGNTVVYQWIAKSYRFFIPQLPNLSLFVSMFVHPLENTEVLETFFASYPEMKHIHIQWDELQLISPESKFYQAESIRITQYRSPTVHAFLRNFKGRQATLCDCECGFVELIKFMNRWRSGEGSRELEYLKIMTRSFSTNLNGVLNANWVKHIDAAKKPPTHSLTDLSTPEPDLKPNTDPIISHTYIVRESDNRVASISVKGWNFIFGVWKETEEEFLRMVE
ncbi:hypothetical protein B9Z55_009167 [Caenorhabditis nigoni]|nr:hypothetical protein B9Z55_009167 [Caenorhabditis nigoni]